MKSPKSRTRVPVSWQRLRQFWSRIKPDKCHDVEKTLHIMVNSIVCGSLLAPHSHRDSIEQIARIASIPIDIESLSGALAKPTFACGRAFFGRLGDVLNEILTNYPDMYWWVSNKGLVVATVDSNYVLPDPFDEVAGSLM